MKLTRHIAMVTMLTLAPALVFAQAQIALSGLSADPSAPVEVTAETLTVDQNTRSATFAGDVVIAQGEMRIGAGSVAVHYDDETGEIARLVLSGGVTFVTPAEEAEAERADYDLASGMLVLSGNVLLSQGSNALSAQEMRVNLRDGTAQMQGQVRTVFGSGQ